MCALVEQTNNTQFYFFCLVMCNGDGNLVLNSLWKWLELKILRKSKKIISRLD
jgi:hypothetical protein